MVLMNAALSTLLLVPLSSSQGHSFWLLFLASSHPQPLFPPRPDLVSLGGLGDGWSCAILILKFMSPFFPVYKQNPRHPSAYFPLQVLLYGRSSNPCWFRCCMSSFVMLCWPCSVWDFYANSKCFFFPHTAKCWNFLKMQINTGLTAELI